MTTMPARGLGRVLWLIGGLVCVGLGGLGAIVPGLPTTVFFIAAAACFTRSSPRLEAWVLGLPGVGQFVRDHRAGLGMPRRAKTIAVCCIVGFSVLAIVLARSPIVAAIVGMAALAGAYVVALRVPTRETVLEQRAAGGPGH